MPSFDIASTIINTASAYGVDPRLALEVAMRESGLSESAVSSKGAIGIFQLMPATAAELGVDPHDAAQNIDGGIRYLSQLIGQFAGDISQALAAYNWGASNVHGAINSYGADWLAHAPGETQSYVTGILANVGSQYTVSSAFAPESGATADAPASDNRIMVGIFVTLAMIGWWLFQDS